MNIICISLNLVQLRWKIIFPFLAKSRAHAHMRMGTRLCKEWENNFPTQLYWRDDLASSPGGSQCQSFLPPGDEARDDYDEISR